MGDMESVVASITGYSGLERLKLQKLISQTGASYVGTMSPSTTHLVCWEFKGGKFEIAKGLNIPIVNHRWVEECVKQRRRVPEHPYILQSGKEAGPLLLEVTPVAENVGALLSTQSNSHVGSEELAINIKCEETNDVDLSDCSLLDESLFYELRTANIGSHKLKNKIVKKKLKKVCSSGKGSCFEEPPLSTFDGIECEDSRSSSSMQVMRQKRSCSTSAEPSRKFRRLVKKSSNRDVSQIICVDPEQESYPVHDHHQDKDMTAPFNSECGRNGNRLRIRMSDNELYNDGGNRNMEEVEDIGQMNDLSFEDSNLCNKVTPSSSDGAPLDPCEVDKNIKDAEHNTGSPELSCVICWTGFSSTRGILPCGHRFCFSCIQKWADQMAKQKISTCPLCKASFVSITKVDAVVSSDQKIYSQTIPHGTETTSIFILPDGEPPTSGAYTSLGPVCFRCNQGEPEELLVRCYLCQIRCVHSYCLDPPLFPWTCRSCEELRPLHRTSH